DGSTDETRATLEELRNAPSLRYFHQTNQGRSAARNHGLANAAGDFVLFLDSDDRLLPNALESLYTQAQADPAAGLTVGRVRFIDATGTPLPFVDERGTTALQTSGALSRQARRLGPLLAAPVHHWQASPLAPRIPRHAYPTLLDGEHLFLGA